jgi:hypothetical protein
MVSKDVPVARLVANLTQYIKEHPDDAEGYYRLGRVHTMALETKLESVMGYDGVTPRPAEGYWARRTNTSGEKPVQSTPAETRTHLAEALRLLNRALAMRPTDARFRLTLAAALEAGEPLREQVSEVWPLAPIAGALNPTDAGKQYVIDVVEQNFRSPTSQSYEVLRQYLVSGYDPDLRDIVMTLAYQNRDKPDVRTLIQRLRSEDWAHQIENQYFTAMSYALPADGRAEQKPIWGGMDNWVSYEAGKAFIRVVEARRSRPSDFIRLRVARETIRAFDSLPTPRAITPIVMDFAGVSLAGIESKKVTSFNLDGSDLPQRWTWVTPGTGILVWDPERLGRITSGRQLFGSATWWVFFDDGYQALDTLDDNRDGVLSRGELDGLAVWFDRNENGISDNTEVVPVDALQIAAIACRATAVEGHTLTNPAGFTLQNGAKLATYDWVSTSAAPLPLTD